MTIEEIQKLTEYQKEVFLTKEDGRKFEEKIDKVQTTLDGFAKQSKDNKEEIIILNRRMKDAENWIDKTSSKLGLKFNH